MEEAGGKALPCILDVRDEQQTKSVVKTAVEKVTISNELAYAKYMPFGLYSWIVQ